MDKRIDRLRFPISYFFLPHVKVEHLVMPFWTCVVWEGFVVLNPCNTQKAYCFRLQFHPGGFL